MIEINVTNFITVGVMALIFFALVEAGKKQWAKRAA
jgi:hypothetical protein